MAEGSEGVEQWVLWVLILVILGAVLLPLSLLLPIEPEELSAPAIMFITGMMSLSLALSIGLIVFVSRWRPGGTTHPMDNRWQAYKNEIDVSLGGCVELGFPSPHPAPEGWSYVKPCFELARMRFRGGMIGATAPYLFIYFLGPIVLLLAIPMSIVFGAWALLNWPRVKTTKPLQDAICKRFELDLDVLEETVVAFHRRENIQVDSQVKVGNYNVPFPEFYNAVVTVDRDGFVLQARAHDESEHTTVFILPYKAKFEDYAKKLDHTLTYRSRM